MMAQAEWCQNNGFPQAAQYLMSSQNANLEHLSKLKELVKE